MERVLHVLCERSGQAGLRVAELILITSSGYKMYTFYVKFQTLADDCSFFKGCALIRLRVWTQQEAILGAIAAYVRHLNLQLSRK